ncbi:hypothetical protein [Pedobacter sp.]|uniref:PID-CTERM protein-sorting domain-containing protein n=1 Tax=Pedobacter sp. TaxID=1411316 RepID=UPI0031D42188
MAVSVSNYVVAQVESEDPGPSNPNDSPNDDITDYPVPIDGGVGILVAAGVAYGMKKVYDKRKQNKNSEAA